MMEINRSKGIVKWFSGQKGFGFIAPDDGGDDLFVHQTEIKAEGFRFLREGQRVEFSLGSGEDGRKKAVEVVVLGRADRSGRGGGGGRRRGGYGSYRGGFGGRRGGRFGGHSGGSGGGRECYNCGRLGHLARDCYGGGDAYREIQGYEDDGRLNGGARGRGRGRGGGGGRGGGRGGWGGTCYHCREEGHFARDCPNDGES